MDEPTITEEPYQHSTFSTLNIVNQELDLQPSIDVSQETQPLSELQKGLRDQKEHRTLKKDETMVLRDITQVHRMLDDTRIMTGQKSTVEMQSIWKA